MKNLLHFIKFETPFGGESSYIIKTTCNKTQEIKYYTSCKYFQSKVLPTRKKRLTLFQLQKILNWLTIVQFKSDKLLETPEKDNQQPITNLNG